MKKTPKNRSEAISISNKRQQLIEQGTEEQLQSSIVHAFNDRYPEDRGRLFATFQNPVPAQYGLWVAKGMIEGVSDLLFSDYSKRLIAIEVKHPDKKHKREHIIRQAQWIIKSAYSGGFCVSVEMFWGMIAGKSNGICPLRVLKYLSENPQVKTVQFKNLLHLQ